MFGCEGYVAAIYAAAEIARRNEIARIKRRSNMTYDQLMADDKYELDERRHQEICSAIRAAKTDVTIHNSLF